MKKFFCLLILSLVLIPMSAAAAHKGPTWGLKPVVLQLLPYDLFLEMPQDKQAQYITEMRTFAAQLESKWYGKTASTTTLEDFAKLFTLMDQAEAEDAYISATAGVDSVYSPKDCKLDNLPAKFQSVVAGGHDKCEIGGYLVCLVYEGDHLRCSTKDPAFDKDFKTFAAQVCGKSGYVPCALPLFANDKDGSQICVPTTGSIFKKCNAASDAAKLAANIAKSPANYKRPYDNYKATVEKYCGTDGGNAHWFDKEDCVAFQNRLDHVKTLYAAAAKSGQVCNVQSTLYKGVKGATPSSVDVTLDMNVDHGTPIYKIEKAGKSTDNWFQTECTSDGRVKNDKIALNQNYLPTPWQPCLARTRDGGKTEVLRFGNAVPPCQLHYEVYAGSKELKDKGNPKGEQCETKLGDQTFAKYTGVKGTDFANQPVFFKYTADTKTPNQGLTLVPNSSPPLYTPSGKADGDGLKFVYDTKAGECWASYSRTLDVETPPPPAAAQAPETGKKQ